MSAMVLGHQDARMAFKPFGYDDRGSGAHGGLGAQMPCEADAYVGYRCAAKDARLFEGIYPASFGATPQALGEVHDLVAPGRSGSRRGVDVVDEREDTRHFDDEFSRQRKRDDSAGVGEGRRDEWEAHRPSRGSPTSVPDASYFESPLFGRNVEKGRDVRVTSYSGVMERGKQLQKLKTMPGRVEENGKLLDTVGDESNYLWHVNLGRRNLRRGSRHASMWKKILSRTSLATPTQPVLAKLSKSVREQKLETKSKSLKTVGGLSTGSPPKLQGQRDGLFIRKAKSTNTGCVDPSDHESHCNTPESCSGTSQGRINEAQRQMEEFLVDTPDSFPSQQSSWRRNVPHPDVSGPIPVVSNGSNWDSLESHDPYAVNCSDGNHQQMMATMPDDLMFRTVQQEDPIATRNTNWGAPEGCLADQSQQGLLTTMPDHLMFATSPREDQLPSKLLASDPLDIFDEFHMQSAWHGQGNDVGRSRGSANKRIRVNVVVEVLKDVSDTELQPLHVRVSTGADGGSNNRLAVAPPFPLTTVSPGQHFQASTSPQPGSPLDGPGRVHEYPFSQRPSSPALSNPPTSPTHQDTAPPQKSITASNESKFKAILSGPQGDIPFSLDSAPSLEVVAHGLPAIGFSASGFYEDHPPANGGGWGIEHRSQSEAQGGYGTWGLPVCPQDSKQFGEPVTGFAAKKTREANLWSTEGYSALSCERQIPGKLLTTYDSYSQKHNEQLRTAPCSQYVNGTRFREVGNPYALQTEGHFREVQGIGMLHTGGFWDESHQFREDRQHEMGWDNGNSVTGTELTIACHPRHTDFEGPRLRLQGSFNSHVPVYSEERVWSLSEVKRLSGIWMKDFKESDDPGQLCDFLELGWIFQKAIMNSRHLEIDVTDEWVRMKAKLFGLFEQTEQLAWDHSGCLVPRRDLRTGFTRVWLERTPGGYRQWSQWGEPVAGEKVEDYRLSQDSQTLTVYAHLVRQQGQILNTRTVFKRV